MVILRSRYLSETQNSPAVHEFGIKPPKMKRTYVVPFKDANRLPLTGKLCEYLTGRIFLFLFSKLGQRTSVHMYIYINKANCIATEEQEIYGKGSERPCKLQ